MIETVSLTAPDPGRGTDQLVMGRCWLGCDPERVQMVVWVGPVSACGPDGLATADAFACLDHVRRLYAMARADEIERDRPPHLADRVRGHP
ncbi:hypothetical protein [Streptomyces radicis]|uniref:hypothetical protein n=1 Tax=Streptomyces radicis TaxID=1750517 RepID=UPI0011C3C301|nr:hypothetical protein [Streptomyces radicis]